MKLSWWNRALGIALGTSLLAVPCAADAHSFVTLVVGNGAPLILQTQAQAAILRGVQVFATKHALYFRVNPLVPDAVNRHPSCLPGTQSLLYVRAYVLSAVADSGLTDNSNVVKASVFVASCDGSGSTFYADVPKLNLGSSVDPALFSVAVDEAFTSLEKNIALDPSTAAKLGLGP